MKKNTQKIHLLNCKSDLPQIEASIHSWLSMIDHLKGDGFLEHPAPACMNRSLIKALEQRIEWMTIKRMAIEIKSKEGFTSNTNVARIISKNLETELKKMAIWDKNNTKLEAVRRIIGVCASKSYP